MILRDKGLGHKTGRNDIGITNASTFFNPQNVMIPIKKFTFIIIVPEFSPTLFNSSDYYTGGDKVACWSNVGMTITIPDRRSLRSQCEPQHLKFEI